MATDDFKRKVAITIPEDLVPAVRQYMETHGIESPSIATRSLMQEALAVTPRDGVAIAAARRAATQMQQMILIETGQFYSELSKRVQSTITEIATQRFQCPHCGGDL
jgi:hypothetical protein